MEQEQPVGDTVPHAGAGAVKGPVPPYAQLFDFLPEADRCRLLEWAIAQEPNFKPAPVFYGSGGTQSGLNRDKRSALKLAGLGPFESILSEKLMEQRPAILVAAGYRGPEPRSLEFELNAYGDGAHFAPHIDIPVGERRVAVGAQPGEDRAISAVYYFHGEPKGFTGGRLRLFRFGTDETNAGPEDTIAFEPVQNSLVVFPSWARHEVERVSCPSGRFEDFRFAVNCWFCRPLHV